MYANISIGNKYVLKYFTNYNRSFERLLYKKKTKAIKNAETAETTKMIHLTGEHFLSCKSGLLTYV